jgi:hypothetical protein
MGKRKFKKQGTRKSIFLNSSAQLPFTGDSMRIGDKQSADNPYTSSRTSSVRSSSAIINDNDLPLKIQAYMLHTLHTIQDQPPSTYGQDNNHDSPSNSAQTPLLVFSTESVPHVQPQHPNPSPSSPPLSQEASLPPTVHMNTFSTAPHIHNKTQNRNNKSYDYTQNLTR